MSRLPVVAALMVTIVAACAGQMRRSAVIYGGLDCYRSLHYDSVEVRQSVQLDSERQQYGIGELVIRSDVPYQPFVQIGRDTVEGAAVIAMILPSSGTATVSHLRAGRHGFRLSYIGIQGATFFMDVRPGGSDTVYLPRPVETPIC